MVTSGSRHCFENFGITWRSSKKKCVLIVIVLINVNCFYEYRPTFEKNLRVLDKSYLISLSPLSLSLSFAGLK